MFPVTKLLIYIVKVLAKPVLTKIQKKHAQVKYKQSSYSTKFFINLGNYSHRLNIKMNQKILNIKSDDDLFFQPLNEDVAL